MSQAKENCNGKRKEIHTSESLNTSENNKSFKKNYTKSEEHKNLHLNFSSIKSALIPGKRKSFSKINPCNIKDDFDGKNSKVNGHIKANEQKIKINNSISIQNDKINGTLKLAKDKTKETTKKVEKKKVNEDEKEIKVDNKELKSSKTYKLDITQDYPSFINNLGISKNSEIIKVIDEINNNLRQKVIGLDKLTPKIQLLIEINPIINPFNNSIKLLEPKDFDIFDKKSHTKMMYEMNLNNLISIINLFYTIIQDNNKFIEYLDKLCLNFSFVKRDKDSKNNEVDLVLLAPEPGKLYNYLSTYGKDLFPNDINNYKEANIFTNSNEKQILDEGYYFEQYSAMNLLNKIGEKKYQINPKILYYIKKEAVENLINLGIICPQKSFSFPSANIKKTGKKYYGYNEMDICFTINENIEIKENENLCFLKYKDDKTEIINNSIEFKKDTRYIFEIKSNIQEVTQDDKLEDIKNKYEKFKEAFENIEKVQKIKIDNKANELIILCNKSIIQVKNEIKKKN